jgi:hypothetical protein
VLSKPAKAREQRLSPGEGSCSQSWLTCFMCDHPDDNRRDIKRLRYGFLEIVKSLRGSPMPRRVKMDVDRKGEAVHTSLVAVCSRPAGRAVTGSRCAHRGPA